MTSVAISLLAMLRGLIRSRAALHLEVLALRQTARRFRCPRPDSKDVGAKSALGSATLRDWLKKKGVRAKAERPRATTRSSR